MVELLGDDLNFSSSRFVWGELCFVSKIGHQVEFVSSFKVSFASEAGWATHHAPGLNFIRSLPCQSEDKIMSRSKMLEDGAGVVKFR